MAAYISVSTVALGAGGSSLNPIQASENVVMLETNVCTSSVFTRFSHFFPSNAFKASARSSNTFHCMLQTRVNWLINAYMAACRLRGFKSDLVKDLYKVQSVTKSSQTKNNNKNRKRNHTNKTKPSNQNKTAKQRRDRCQFMG